MSAASWSCHAATDLTAPYARCHGILCSRAARRNPAGTQSCTGVISDRHCLQAACGDKGQPCCPGDDNSDWCGGNRSIIRGNRRCSDDSGIGTCLGCGGVGEVCCQRRPSEEPECARGAVCTGSRCEPCGGFGELCCASTSRPCLYPTRGGCSDGRCATAEVRAPTAFAVHSSCHL